MPSTEGKEAPTVSRRAYSGTKADEVVFDLCLVLCSSVPKSGMGVTWGRGGAEREWRPSMIFMREGGAQEIPNNGITQLPIDAGLGLARTNGRKQHLHGCF